MFNCYECLLLYLKGFKQVFKLNTLGCCPNLNYLLSSVTDQGTRRHFYNGTSTITILVDIMMLEQCMLPVIASDLVNRMPILGLMECIASDSRK